MTIQKGESTGLVVVSGTGQLRVPSYTRIARSCDTYVVYEITHTVVLLQAGREAKHAEIPRGESNALALLDMFA